jgi:hypothetical protein
MLRELLASLEVSIDWRGMVRMPRRADLRELRDALRDGGPLAVVAGPERRALLDRVQATMAMVEGHAEHVMDAVGEEVLPDLPSLRNALQRRRGDRPPLMRLLEKVLGLEMKMALYEVGKSFCDEIVSREGVASSTRESVWRRISYCRRAVPILPVLAWCLIRTRCATSLVGSTLRMPSARLAASGNSGRDSASLIFDSSPAQNCPRILVRAKNNHSSNCGLTPSRLARRSPDQRNASLGRVPCSVTRRSKSKQSTATRSGFSPTSSRSATRASGAARLKPARISERDMRRLACA